jgi:putative transport protein
MKLIAELLQEYPELALFLCLAGGYWIGSLKIGRFSLGTVVGTLVVALIVGQAQVTVPDFIRTLFFALFMFSIGYHVGPQFFSGLRKSGLTLVAIALVFSFSAVGMVLLMAKIFGFDKGFAAGLLSGALTQSSVIGTATDAINRLTIPEHLKTQLAHHVPLGDAVTYIFGAIAPAILLPKFAARLMGTDLKAECRKVEDELGGKDPKASGAFDSYVAIDLQAFRVDRPELAGKALAWAEIQLPDRCYIHRIRHDRHLLPPTPDFVLQLGDVLVISGDREQLLKVESVVGRQVVDPEAMDVPFETMRVIVTRPLAIGKTLAELRDEAPARAKGVHLRKIIRQGRTLPRLPHTRVDRGDVLVLAGRAEDLKRTAEILGYPDVPSEKSDIVFIGVACVVGVLIGLFSVRLGIVEVGLGTSGGILIIGLVFGWIHSMRPSLGRIPAPSVWLMQTLGLNVFIAAVGLAAGPHAVAAMKSSGLQLLVAGMAVTMVPYLLSLLIGRFVFKMNGAILLGACAGAGTAIPAMQAINDESQSAVPTLGFTVPFALSNALLAAAGPVVVTLVP